MGAGRGVANGVVVDDLAGADLTLKLRFGR
jgi:hypothetical protein